MKAPTPPFLPAAFDDFEEFRFDQPLVGFGEAVADELGLRFVEVFEDRFVSGVSHPKEFRNLPPLVWRTKPAAPTLVIDDLATSGMHIEEALGLLRGLGLPSFGAVWISGT